MLPAPVVIPRSEVQSSVQLAPLAEFLAGLTENEHLNKLNDIHDRFRTPKSYHRVDIRIVSSSDLPPSPGKEGADVDDYTLMKWSMERGDPIIVDDQPEAGPSGTSGEGDAEGGERMDVDIDPNGQPEIDRETQPSVADGEDLARRPQHEGREDSSPLSLPEQLFSDASSPKGNGTPFHSAPHSPEKNHSPASTNAEMRTARGSEPPAESGNAEKEKEQDKGKGKEKEAAQPTKRLSAGMPIPLPPPAATLPMAVHFQFGLPPPVVPAPAEPVASTSNGTVTQANEPPAPEPASEKEASNVDATAEQPAEATETVNEGAAPVEQPAPVDAAEENQKDNSAAGPEGSAPEASDAPAAQAQAASDVPSAAPDASVNTTSADQHTAADEELNQVLADKDAALVAIADASRSPSPFTPSHPPPPGGSARFVRELRLDLRILDSAALFELETWRREVLGLPPMDRIVPDSIWYQQIEPEPVPKKKGRPTNAEREAARLEKAAKAAENGQLEPEGEEEVEPEEPEEEEEEDDIDVPSDKEEDYVPPAVAKKLGTGRPRGRPRQSETAPAPEAEVATGEAAAAPATEPAEKPKKGGRPSKAKPAEPSTTPLEMEETEHVLDMLGPSGVSPSPEPAPAPVERIKPRRSIVEVVIPSPARSLASPATRSVPRNRKQSLKEAPKETPTRSRGRKSIAKDETPVSPGPRRSRRSNVAFDLEGSRPPSSSPPAPTRRTRASQAAVSPESASPPPAPVNRSSRRTSRAAAELSSASPIRSPSPLPVLRTRGKAVASPSSPPARRSRRSDVAVETPPAPAPRRSRLSQVTVEPSPPASRKRKASAVEASPAPPTRRTRHAAAEEASVTPPPSKRATRSSGPAILPELEPASTRKRRLSVSSDETSPAPASKRTRPEPAKRHTAKRSGALPAKAKVTARRSGGAPPAKSPSPPPPPAPRARRSGGAPPAKSSPVRARRSGGALPTKAASPTAPRARRSGALPPKAASPPAPRAKRSGGALPTKKPVMAKRSGAPPKPAARTTRARGSVSSASPEPSPAPRARTARSETRNERIDYVELPAPRVKLDMTLKRGRESYGRSVALKVEAGHSDEGSDDEWEMFRNL